jgi:hypothetical protein
MIPKYRRIESKALRESIHGKTCLLNVSQVCKMIARDPTVVPCHAPSEGKGWGIRSSDVFACAGCFDCHTVLDRRAVYPLTGKHITDDEAAYYWLRALQRQWQLWIEEGLIFVKGHEA